ncbi:ribbon-helix-helix domain-containing protein [Bacillus phage vB_BauM_KLEB27-3]|nr:ribbon-helix-helix domain-containing protein [Bacillus phage vB_BauM_KLEB27-3]
MKIEKERFTTYIPTKLKEDIVKLSNETRIPQAGLFEEAVVDLLEKYKEKGSTVKDILKNKEH